MNRIRTFFDITIVGTTSILIALLALDKLNGTDNKILITLFLQLMHVSLVIGAILNLNFYIRKKKYLIVFIIALPIFLLLIAFVGVFFGFRFPNLMLIIFDFYLLYLFLLLAIKELNTQQP